MTSDNEPLETPEDHKPSTPEDRLIERVLTAALDWAKETKGDGL